MTCNKSGSIVSAGEFAPSNQSWADNIVYRAYQSAISCAVKTQDQKWQRAIRDECPSIDIEAIRRRVQE